MKYEQKKGMPVESRQAAIPDTTVARAEQIWGFLS